MSNFDKLVNRILNEETSQEPSIGNPEDCFTNFEETQEFKPPGGMLSIQDIKAGFKGGHPLITKPGVTAEQAAQAISKIPKFKPRYVAWFEIPDGEEAGLYKAQPSKGTAQKAVDSDTTTTDYGFPSKRVS